MNRPFAGSVLAALAASLAAALAAVAVPGQSLPAVAMSSELVWRMEIGAIAFVLLYTVIVVLRLASAGLTPLRIGTMGVELPQVVATIRETNETQDVDYALGDDLSRGITGLFETLSGLEERLERLEEKD